MVASPSALAINPSLRISASVSLSLSVSLGVVAAAESVPVADDRRCRGLASEQSEEIGICWAIEICCVAGVVSAWLYAGEIR